MKNRSVLLFVLIFFSSAAFAGGWGHQPVYEVSITNITKGQKFTPILGASHNHYANIFELGAPASAELATLAEAGNVAPLKELLDASSEVQATTMTAGLLDPGATVTFTLPASRWKNRLSFAAMLVPTNDTFVSLNGVSLPKWGSKTAYAKAYDAGSELNDESCLNVPGPACGGMGDSVEDGEGFVHISAGIHGEGDLSAAAYDWRDVVAKVVITRIQ